MRVTFEHDGQTSPTFEASSGAGFVITPPGVICAPRVPATGRADDEARELLRELGMPFREA